MGTDMIQAFRELNDNESRMAALDALTQELSPYEWRTVASKLHARTFQFDLVRNLPVEIVVTIFSYLDTTTPFRLQAVSWPWYTLLRSPVVWKQGLRAWFDGTLGCEEDYDHYAAKALDIHRFRTGKYADSFTLTYDENDIVLECAALFEETLVHVVSNQRELVVRNLRKRTSWKTHGDAREKIQLVSVSHQLVAYATSLNVCYVSDLVGEEKANFKLPPGMLKVLACRGRTVVCGGPRPDAAEVYIWDFDRRRGRSFRIGYDQPPFVHREYGCQHIDMAIIPNMNSQVLTVFTSQRCASRECCHTEGSSIYYTRFNYGGHILGEGRFHLPDIRGSEIKDVLPVDRCGGYALEVRTCLSKKSEGYPFSAQEGRSLFFDDKANTFKDPRCPIPQSRSVYTVPQEVKWWKDTFYQVRPGKESFPKGYSTTKASETETLLAYMGTSEGFRFRPVLTKRDQFSWTGDTLLLLNDRFAVVLDRSDGWIHTISFESARQGASIGAETEIIRTGDR